MFMDPDNFKIHHTCPTFGIVQNLAWTKMEEKIPFPTEPQVGIFMVNRVITTFLFLFIYLFTY